MMSLTAIRSMSREVAKAAAMRDLQPFRVEKEDIEDWKRNFRAFPFPSIGDYRPKQHELVDTLFCDKTGMGAVDEPALTKDQLLRRLRPGYCYAIIEEGQFQLYLGEFKQVLRKVSHPKPSRHSNT